MTLYNTLNIKWSNSQLSKLKSGINNGTELTFKISMNVAGELNDTNNYPHKSLSCNTQFWRLGKSFANCLSVNIKLSKTQLHKVLGRLLGPLLKNGLPLIGNALKILAKSVLIPLGLTAAAPATDTAIHKKMFDSRARPPDLASSNILNKEMNDIMKIIRSLEEPGLLIKSISETIKNETKQQKGGFLSILATLGASLLGNLKTGQGAIETSQGQCKSRTGEDNIREDQVTIRAGQDF